MIGTEDLDEADFPAFAEFTDAKNSLVQHNGTLAETMGFLDHPLVFPAHGSVESKPTG